MNQLRGQRRRLARSDRQLLFDDVVLRAAADGDVVHPRREIEREPTVVRVVQITDGMLARLVEEDRGLRLTNAAELDLTRNRPAGFVGDRRGDNAWNTERHETEIVGVFDDSTVRYDFALPIDQRLRL